MKIIGGNLKGRNFFMPHGVRPTPDLLRKAIFDILGQDLSGLDFLDLFAGSGAVGLEALSRNARTVVFVEKEIPYARVIEENLKTLNIKNFEENYYFPQVITADAFATVKRFEKMRKKFDIVFFDPPYYLELAKKTLKSLLAHDILKPNCLIVAQHEKRELLPSLEGSFVLVRAKRYGTSTLTIYKKEPYSQIQDPPAE